MTTYNISCSGQAIWGSIPLGMTGPIMSVTTSTSNLPPGLQIVSGGPDFITSQQFNLSTSVICNIIPLSGDGIEVSGSFQYSGISVTGATSQSVLILNTSGITTFPGGQTIPGVGAFINWPLSSSIPLTALLTFPLQTAVPPGEPGIPFITFFWALDDVTDVSGTFNIDLTIVLE